MINLSGPFPVHMDPLPVLGASGEGVDPPWVIEDHSEVPISLPRKALSFRGVNRSLLAIKRQPLS